MLRLVRISRSHQERPGLGIYQNQISPTSLEIFTQTPSHHITHTHSDIDQHKENILTPWLDQNLEKRFISLSKLLICCVINSNKNTKLVFCFHWNTTGIITNFPISNWKTERMFLGVLKYLMLKQYCYYQNNVIYEYFYYMSSNLRYCFIHWYQA